MIYPITKNGFLTHTFSECVENHAGMQMLGKRRAVGFDAATLRAVAASVEGASVVELGGQGADEACVVVIKKGVNKLLKDPDGADKLLAESVSKPFDSTFLNVKRKVVQTKHGRYNNCYADAPQEPDIPNGKGTVVAFGDAPVMAKLRAALPELLGEGAEGLFAETNYYKDVTDKKVGIGWHGVSRPPSLCSHGPLLCSHMLSRIAPLAGHRTAGCDWNAGGPGKPAHSVPLVYPFCAGGTRVCD
jgi:hypothetical protein